VTLFGPMVISIYLFHKFFLWKRLFKVKKVTYYSYHVPTQESWFKTTRNEVFALIFENLTSHLLLPMWCVQYCRCCHYGFKSLKGKKSKLRFWFWFSIWIWIRNQIQNQIYFGFQINLVSQPDSELIWICNQLRIRNLICCQNRFWIQMYNWSQIWNWIQSSVT
jgi:hypothetical protein